MSDTVTIRRKPETFAYTHVASGPYNLDVIGDGPWTVDADLWRGVKDAAAEWLEIVTDGNPMPAEEKPPMKASRSRVPSSDATEIVKE